MPIKTDALLADAGDLPNELFGAYCRLLFRWWREGAQPEPDARRLCRWANLTPKKFEILLEFLSHTENGFIQKNLQATFEEARARSVKARVSAHKRWKVN